MTLRTIVLGAGTLTIGRVLSQVLALARHVIVGRMLSPDDLGIAALLMVSSAMLELMTNFSVDKLLVQAPDGDESDLQGAAQSFLAIRGLVLGCVALALAGPLGGVFGIPEASWAFAAFGAVPLIHGLRHLDCKRAHRTGRFKSDMIVEVIPQLIVTAVAWPVLYWIQGYTGVLWLLVMKALLSVMVSHVVAQRTYAWSWSTSRTKQIVRFGWPLLLGSGLIFVVSQGDQLIIGSAYSMRELGLFAVAATIAIAFGTMISSITSTLLLPVLSNQSSDQERFLNAHAMSVLGHMLAATAMGVFFIVLGPILVEALYGGRYAASGGILGWLGIAQAIRLVRVSPTVACIARGDTLGPMIANACRASVIPAVIGAAAAGFDLVWIVVIGIVGELFALGVLSIRASHKQGLDIGIIAASCGASCGVMGLALSGTAALGIVPAAVAIGGLMSGVLVLAFISRNRWSHLVLQFFRISSGGGQRPVNEVVT